MHDGDTRMGGARNAFPETAWSSVIAGSPERLNDLCGRYWRPVYAYVRAAYAKSVDEGKDLTQEFFCHLLERGSLTYYSPERGRFRAFLKAAVRQFMSEEHRRSTALKRGGGKPVLSMDFEDAGPDTFVADLKSTDPGEIFDRQWAHEVLRTALGRLKDALAREGKEDHFRLYESYALRDPAGPGPTYEDLAKAHGLAVSEVTNRLHALRVRLHGLLVEEVSQSVDSPEGVLQEMKDLFSR